MSDAWPDLPFEPWRPTCDTLHMWTQIVGKVRLALAPHVNHWWQVALYLSARGLDQIEALPYLPLVAMLPKILDAEHTVSSAASFPQRCQVLKVGLDRRSTLG